MTLLRSLPAPSFGCEMAHSSRNLTQPLSGGIWGLISGRRGRGKSAQRFLSF